MEQEISHIDRLPDEILLKIFKYIRGHYLAGSAMGVCQRWKKIISEYVYVIQCCQDKVHLRRGATALLVTGNIYSSLDRSALLSQIVYDMPYLKELTINVDYSLHQLELEVLDSLPTLRHFDVFVYKNVLDGETPLAWKITSLVVNNNIAPGFLRSLEEPGRVIKEFHMYGKCIYYPPKEFVNFVKHHANNLTELTLRCSELTDKRYETISRCAGLRSLQLYTCSQLTSRGAHCLTNLKQLRCLHLTGMGMMRVNPLFDFIQRLPRRIEELNLSASWFGDEHCSALVARLPRLRSLELWRCRISSFSLIQLAKMLTSLENLDTDVLLMPANIKSLSDHLSLKVLRCRWSGQLDPRTESRLIMKSAMDVIPMHYLRDENEGPRSELFYYWLQASPFPGPSMFLPAIPSYEMQDDYREMNYLPKKLPRI